MDLMSTIDFLLLRHQQALCNFPFSAGINGVMQNEYYIISVSTCVNRDS